MRPYRCDGCSAEGVKLWREYQTWGAPELRCARCAAELADKIAYEDISEDGSHYYQYGWPEKKSTDIGWWVPAVISKEDLDAGTLAFWGKTSGEDEDWAAWSALPLEVPSMSEAQ